MLNYNDSYFNEFHQLSYESALKILRPIFEIKEFSNIVDIGCGSGAWLEACSDLSKSSNIRLTGVDGKYMKNQKKFKKANYFYKDLEKDEINGSYDLLISVEVAEHLDKKKIFIFY